MSINIQLELADDVFTEEEHARLDAALSPLTMPDTLDRQASLLCRVIRQLEGRIATKPLDASHCMELLSQCNGLQDMLLEAVQKRNFITVRRLSKDLVVFILCTSK